MHRFKLVALLFALALALALTARAQSVLLTINVTNPSAVTFTAVSGNQAQASYSGALFDGVTLANIFQPIGAASTIFLSGALQAPSTTLIGSPTQATFFEVKTDSSGLVVSVSGTGEFDFQTGSTAFSGSATANLSGGVIPANGVTGNIHGGSGTGGAILGTYVVVSSIPEPSTYALVGGACVLGVVVLRRSRAKQPASGQAQ